MIDIAFLRSGSKGNATLISDGKTLLLVDMGVAKSVLQEGCALFDKSIEDIDAVFFTHNHSDHIKGARYLDSRTPRYAPFPAIDGCSNLPFGAKDKMAVGNIQVEALSASHDAPGAINFLFQVDGEKLAYITDTGKIKRDTLKKIANCDYYLMESNYDVDMETHSGRSSLLISRVLGEKGHLSNVASAQYFFSLYGEKTKAVYLGHISDDCNTHELALQAYADRAYDLGVVADGIKIKCTSQHHIVLGGDWSL